MRASGTREVSSEPSQTSRLNQAQRRNGAATEECGLNRATLLMILIPRCASDVRSHLCLLSRWCRSSFSRRSRAWSRRVSRDHQVPWTRLEGYIYLSRPARRCVQSIETVYSLRFLSGLGHVRLSIIDLPTGQQPLSDEENSIHCVVTGEIYDHDRIRAEMESQGYSFKSKSDSELVVQL